MPTGQGGMPPAGPTGPVGKLPEQSDLAQAGFQGPTAAQGAGDKQSDKAAEKAEEKPGDKKWFRRSW